MVSCTVPPVPVGRTAITLPAGSRIGSILIPRYPGEPPSGTSVGVATVSAGLVSLAGSETSSNPEIPRDPKTRARSHGADGAAIRNRTPSARSSAWTGARATRAEPFQSTTRGQCQEDAPEHRRHQRPLSRQRAIARGPRL